MTSPARVRTARPPAGALLKNPGGNLAIIRNLYQLAKSQNSAGFAALFAEDGIFVDEGTGHTYRGAKALARSVKIYATAMPDIHREIADIHVAGDQVIVELLLTGTSTGFLEVPGIGFLLPTGKAVEVSCRDVFIFKEGKIASFHSYHES